MVETSAEVNPSTGSRIRPGGGFELAAWVFMRLSGIALLALALGHLAVMHLVNNIEVIGYDFVAGRYRLVFWRAYDWFLLSLALFHGMNGLRVVAEDFIHSHRARTAARWALSLVSVGLFLLGTWVVVAFHPPAPPG